MLSGGDALGRVAGGAEEEEEGGGRATMVGGQRLAIVSNLTRDQSHIKCDTLICLILVVGYSTVMADTTGESIPKPGTAEIGFMEFGPASARRAALKTAAPREPGELPLQKAEYAPTPSERIAAALERIADALESR